MTSRPHLLERIASGVALVLLFAGVGALGWLASHIATYDAVGHAHSHSSHEYMAPVQRGSLLLAGGGILLAIALLAVGRRALVAWMHDVRGRGDVRPWIAAAALPAGTFAVVELLEGSVGAAGGTDLLLLGVPLQAAVGLIAILLVRTIVLGLARAVDLLAGDGKRRAPRVSATSNAPMPRVPLLARRAPMASNAPRRGPPQRS